MQPGHNTTAQPALADLIPGDITTSSAPCDGATLQEAVQRVFARTLAQWAMDVLRLRTSGMDTPRAWGRGTAPAGPAMPAGLEALARDVRQAA